MPGLYAANTISKGRLTLMMTVSWSFAMVATTYPEMVVFEVQCRSSRRKVHFTFTYTRCHMCCDISVITAADRKWALICLHVVERHRLNKQNRAKKWQVRRNEDVF